MEYVVTWYPIHGKSQVGATVHVFKKCSMPICSNFPNAIEFTSEGKQTFLIGGSYMFQAEE